MRIAQAAIDNANEEIEKLEARCQRYREALEMIAVNQIGREGMIAREALRETDG